MRFFETVVVFAIAEAAVVCIITIYIYIYNYSKKVFEFVNFLNSQAFITFNYQFRTEWVTTNLPFKAILKPITITKFLNPYAFRLRKPITKYLKAKSSKVEGTKSRPIEPVVFSILTSNCRAQSETKLLICQGIDDCVGVILFHSPFPNRICTWGVHNFPPPCTGGDLQDNLQEQ